MTDGKVLDRAMQKAGITPSKLALLTGRSRSTVWRWRKGKDPVPAYAWTIIRLQARVQALVNDINSTHE